MFFTAVCVIFLNSIYCMKGYGEMKSTYFFFLFSLNVSLSYFFLTLKESVIFPTQVRFRVQPKRNGEVGTFKWSINSTNYASAVACSPSFEAFSRKWRIFCAKRGDSVEYGLEIRTRSQLHSFGIKVILRDKTDALSTKTSHQSS